MCTSPMIVTLTLLTLPHILNLPLLMDLILTLDSLLDPVSTRLAEGRDLLFSLFHPSLQDSTLHSRHS